MLLYHVISVGCVMAAYVDMDLFFRAVSGASSHHDLHHCSLGLSRSEADAVIPRNAHIVQAMVDKLDH